MIRMDTLYWVVNELEKIFKIYRLCSTKINADGTGFIIIADSKKQIYKYQILNDPKELKLV